MHRSMTRERERASISRRERETKREGGERREGHLEREKGGLVGEGEGKTALLSRA